MENVHDVLQLESDDKGNITMRGVKVRVKHGSPNKIAIIDTIMAIRGVTRKAAQIQWVKLMKKHTLTFEGVPLSNGGSPVPMTSLDHLIVIISKLKGPIAEYFALQGAQSFARIQGGDTTLHAEIDANNAEQQRLSVEDPSHPARQFGEYVESNQALTVPEWAETWREKRTIQKDGNKTLMEVIKQTGHGQPMVYASVNNYQNQSILGFQGTTKQFKKDNCIKDATPLAECMTSEQLTIMRLMGGNITRKIEETPLISQEGIMSASRKIRDEVSDIAKYFNIHGLLQKDLGAQVHKIEIGVKKSKRQMAKRENNAKAILDKKKNSKTTLDLFFKRV
jgi:hypothetical protein